MKTKRIEISLVKYLMLFLNWVTVTAVTGFILVTTDIIRDSYVARDFIDRVEALPRRPGMIFAACALLMGILTCTFIMRDIVHFENGKLEAGSLVFDFVVSIAIVSLLNFNYNGILLWVFANVIFYTKNSSGQFVFMLLAVLSFVGTDYGLVSVNCPLYDIQDYIGCYEAGQQSYILGFYNVLISLNMVIFIIFCVFVIQEQRGTIQEVNELYGKLSVANEELQQANIQLQKYADMKEKMGQTKERNRLAREIHDTLGHTLTGISAGIDACIAMIEIAPDKTKSQLEVISGVTREGIQEIRRSVSQLRPDALERLSLESAIQKLVKDTNTLAKTKVTFDCQVRPLYFGEDEEKAIYRVIQESLTNAMRHGQATQVEIRMWRRDGDVRLTIQDNGVGCEKIKPGFGTEHIKERIALLNGTVVFDGSHGFLVDATIPIRWGGDYDQGIDSR
ncbi:MAG: sensor histidine kinase [Lachnospiraceae bacterium]|jgi:signal transduction histidine kinase|nr:sensor histidine kinase [Lachnospiraceae bacterium]MCI9470234.1 sensor histidine kinase [Lachnospiraceae bacterium]